MIKENELSLKDTVSDVDKIRVVTKDGLSQSIEVGNLKNSLSVDDLPARVFTLETKADTNETDHLNIFSKIDLLELAVGKEEVDGETITNFGLFEKISKVRSDLSDLYLEEVNRLDSELIEIRADLISINGTDNTDGELAILTKRVNAGFKIIDEPPVNANSTGQQGEVCWDTTYLYVCVGTNTWKRIPFPAWT